MNPVALVAIAFFSGLIIGAFVLTHMMEDYSGPVSQKLRGTLFAIFGLDKEATTEQK